MTSLNQHRKIQELEAQLNEAEDIITDLRAELTQVWHESERAKNKQVQSFEGQNVTQVAAFEESAKPETLVSSRDQELEYVTLCDRIRALGGKLLDKKLHTQYVNSQHFGIENGPIDKDNDGQVLFKAKKGACSLRSINLCAISKWKRRLRHARMKSSVLEHCKPLFVLKHCSSVCGNLKCSEDKYVAKNTVPPLTDMKEYSAPFNSS
ncbi:hypothetical protein RIF29_25117 [Crotalaria pallida]|uniref:Uncharacterized protein n=1 Tax=Crotalaria pallida TaxID=3830 RepID=A0AAN9HZI1_CROPI